jgi:hypothetical protein
MMSDPGNGGPGCGRGDAGRSICLLMALLALSAMSAIALPRRLVLGLDGVAFRDMKALQDGVNYTDLKGRQFHRQAFHQEYFPVSRMVSTFPSASDVAWTEILGDRPPPGYQRTYFCDALNAEIFDNGITSTMEYERQMTWQVEGGFRRAMGYVFPLASFNTELNELAERFLTTKSKEDNYYAYFRSTDDAQHLSGDIFAMLCKLEEKLQQLCTRYQALEGRNLEILILSDHGCNHAGPARRVEVRSYLKKAGYRITTSLASPKDVVLPTAGMESWVEIHNSPAETENLMQLLSRMAGVDVLTAQAPGQSNRFIVMNSKGERASIEWNTTKNAFRYSGETGDPINYQPVVQALSRTRQLDPDGFATADAWLAESIGHRYPLALERIARAHTRVTLNPATILISLDNHYLHAGWLVKKASEFVWFGGTHGGLDDLNSTGVLLSNFAPTQDTSSSRVASLYHGFQGLRDYRTSDNGAEWVSAKAEALTSIVRGSFDLECRRLSADEIFLRVWSPRFAHLGSDAPVDVTVRKARQFVAARVRRSDPEPVDASEQHLTFSRPVAPPDKGSCERAYAMPATLALEPQKEYRISGRICDGDSNIRVFDFAFYTDARGRPVAY